jgi:hypothetical protein
MNFIICTSTACLIKKQSSPSFCLVVMLDFASVDTWTLIITAVWLQKFPSESTYYLTLLSWVWCVVSETRINETRINGPIFIRNHNWSRMCYTHSDALLNVCSIRGYLCLFSSRRCSRLYRIQLRTLLTKCVWWPFCSPGLVPCDFYLWRMLKRWSVQQ